jgi:hypothetical protein
MRNAIDNLNHLLSNELERLDKIIEINNSPLLFIDLIRAIDTYFISDYKGKEEFDAYILYGYSRFLKQLYLHSNFNADFLPLFTSSINSLSFYHYYLAQYGKCRIVERYIELANTSEIQIEEPAKNQFIVKIHRGCFLEYFENKSVSITNRDCNKAQAGMFAFM